MKFAKELEGDAVPEWRIKYLNYKAGKKHVKAVARATARANATPRSGQRPPSRPSLTNAFSPRQGTFDDRDDDRDDDRYRDLARAKDEGAEPAQWRRGAGISTPVAIPGGRENDSLTGAPNLMHYGSIVASPPHSDPISPIDDSNLELPDPAMRSASNHNQPPGSPTYPRKASGKLPVHWSASSSNTYNDVGMQSLDLVREKEIEFYAFLDSELDKVESFYRFKEDQAGQRLSALKDQLHEMRNRRIEEVAMTTNGGNSGGGAGTPKVPDGADHDLTIPKGRSTWILPIKRKMFPPGPNSQNFSSMPQTPHIGALNRGGDAGRDYIRRPENQEVSYRTAKRKLKLALQEFYREMELLKSYALLNRTAFRKLNKKHDKAVNARPPYRYVNEKVNNAWFVRSDAIDSYIQATEDLYARYFERGNHKLAAEKLRSLNRKRRDQASSTFQSGFLLGTGIVFTIQGLVKAAQLLRDDDEEVRVNTGYLLQIYGGYFLMLSLFALFCLDCMIWSRNKVNYPFIFEFDQRHLLDWAVMAEFPSFFLLLLGIISWANFNRYGPDDLFLHYPVILIVVTAVIIFLPFRILAYRSRKWFAYSHWRLLLAGIYPVEFRDFFLGDMYCSLTYAMSNVELFFCLYSRSWEDPSQCNSSHSKLMGFLSALPPIWRFLQCLRRYKDSGNMFPHLANGGKYTMTIMTAVALSMYRIHGSRTNLALFITFSVVNSLYTSVWDIFMDFSLIQVDSKHFALRDILALKKRWPYYVAIVVDPILRFSWIFYAIFTHDSQHSTIVSFLVGLAEIFRRGLWALFRVENEHCGNVSQYKASRDIPLPYRMEPLLSGGSTSPKPSSEVPPMADSPELQRPHTGPSRGDDHDHDMPSSAQEEGMAGSSTAVAGKQTQSQSGMRQRADTARSSRGGLSRILAEAHKQDFVKKRRSLSIGEDVNDHSQAVGEHVDDDDDDDEDDDEDDDNDGVGNRQDDVTRQMSRDIGEARDLARRGTMH
ncbi:hypothetical protein GMORB2_3028 [Geosmithia morbida]|uniref:Uncharacterized protein n=1 Tax=Geosmithia morbida TaxID=1094350 RepID=A0A9P5D292_9HYPO|nr:uncharacterized protein GMORB2_3028 [Geosmithia morbida]KAF4120590.1 hypothetical protein GMORB2_3028 [Geosmithia morbida]